MIFIICQFPKKGGQHLTRVSAGGCAELSGVHEDNRGYIGIL